RGSDDAGAASGGTGGRARPEATVQATAQRLDRQYSPGTHPSSAWTGGATEPAEVAGGDRAALPAAAATSTAAAFSAHGGAGAAAESAGSGRLGRGADTVPAVQHGWDQGDEPEPVVIPSRVAGGNQSAQRMPRQRTGESGTERPLQRAAAAAPGGPRRAESEMVAGRPVHVLYRPSQGLEVRQDMRDTDSAVR